LLPKSARRTLLRGISKQAVKQCERALLGQRLVAVAAFGGLNAGRAAGRAFAASDGKCGGAQPLRRGREAALGEPGAAIVPVVNEDCQPAGLRVQVRGHPADIPSVTGGYQRKQADGGMLGGVRGACQVDTCAPQLSALTWGKCPPDSSGPKRTEWQIKRLLTKQLTGFRLPAGKGNDLPGNKDIAEMDRRGTPLRPAMLGAHRDAGQLRAEVV